MNEKSTYIITCSLEEGSVERVRTRLEEIGFSIDEVLEFAGSITGTWLKPIDELQKIEEVDAVELSQTSFAQASKPGSEEDKLGGDDDRTQNTP